LIAGIPSDIEIEMSTSAAPKQVAIGIVVETTADGTAFHRGPNGGLVLAKVEKFGTAYKAGLQVGDELVSFEGQTFATPQDGLAILQTLGVGATVSVEAFRGGERLTVPMKLYEKKVVKFDLDDISNVLERKISPAA
jgi:S1-C subfamily serine protease